jgi:tyrosinase
LALFQAAKPGEYFPVEGYSDRTYTFTQGPQFDYISTPLTPFTSTSDGTMWTPDSSRSMSAFGYSYPEIDDWNQDPGQLAQNVTAQVNRLYGTSSINSALKARQFASPSKQWFVDISVDRYEMNEQFIVWVFLGDPPTDSGAWKYSTNLIGSLVVFTPPEVMQGKGVSTTYGEIALQDALSRAGLPNLDDGAVVEHLKENLQWKLQKV